MKKLLTLIGFLFLSHQVLAQPVWLEATNQNLVVGKPMKASHIKEIRDAISWGKNEGNIFFNSGKVGIGTSNPLASLHVNGNIVANTPTINSHVATKGYVDSNSGDISSIDDITDVNVADVSADNVLYYNGSNWIAADMLEVLKSFGLNAFVSKGFCWGDGGDYKLGNASTSYQYTPVKTNFPGWKSTSVGARYSCGILFDGTAKCWGSGYLGNGGYTWGAKSLVEVVGGASWSSISAGYQHTCGIKTDGTVWCWGYAALGRLGTGNSTSQYTPRQISGGGTWLEISAGSEHTCGIKSDKTAWCWGRGYEGQLGNNSANNAYAPVQVSGKGLWKSIAAGQEHSCGVKTDGTAWCWGDEGGGVLGNGGKRNDYSIPYPVQVSGSSGWESVWAKNQHNCGIKTNGTVWCWGHGNGASLKRVATTPQQVGWSRQWKTISVGNTHNCGIKTDGTAWCWGTGRYLGSGYSSDTSYPVQVGSSSDWNSISAGYSHTCGTTLRQ